MGTAARPATTRVIDGKGRREPPVSSIASWLFYWVGNTLLRAVLSVVTRWKVHGRENLPADGGAVIVANHLSYADPPLLAVAVGRRRVIFMAKVEIFRLPWGIVPRLYGALPVRRFAADAPAMLRAERVIRDGKMLGMFPEGTRGRPGRVLRMHHGASMLALRSGAPIIPVAITGTEALNRPRNFLRRPRVEIVIGTPIEVALNPAPERADLESLTITARAAVEKLYHEATGHPVAITPAPTTTD